MKEREEREEPRRELLLILLIVPLGILCMFLAGQAATRFDPFWAVTANMDSNLDPDNDFTGAPDLELLEPVSSDILTQPVWGDLFLTPGVVIPTRVVPTQPPTSQPQPTSQPTVVIPTTNPTLIPPPTSIIPTQPPPPPSPPPPPPPQTQRANLGISKSDSITTYIPGGNVQYTIIASNAGPNNVTGATVTDTFDATRLSNITWSCSAVGGATCAANGTGDISDTVNLPVGSSVTYIVDADIIGTSSGDLFNMATVSHASITDPDTSNNSATDTDAENTEPDFGLPDGNYYDPGDGISATFPLPVPIRANGNATPDFVYYEFLYIPTEVLMDWVQIEISADQVTWYTVFFWGNCTPPDPPGPPGTCTVDTNTNVNINVIGGYESDNRSFAPANLYNSSGVTIDIDAIPGIMTGVDYSYIRITAPIIGGSTGYGDGLTMDAIQPYYP
jgi:uncharacterized repeat protein (TIGR01451 family)